MTVPSEFRDFVNYKPQCHRDNPNFKELEERCFPKTYWIHGIRSHHEIGTESCQKYRVIPCAKPANQLIKNLITNI